MVHVAQEMEREGFRLPLLIGGATTSRAHTAVKIAPHYHASTVHVLDASRAVGVVNSLLNAELKSAFDKKTREDYERLRREHSARTQRKNLLPLEEARANRTPIGWSNYVPPKPEFLGARVYQSAGSAQNDTVRSFSLRTLAEYVERFPERLHHPNEETYLYRVLLRREPGTARLVARLRRDHAASTGYANRLRDALADWERGNPKAGLRAVHVANDFARFMWRHACFEEREILPIARAAFTEAEWQAVGRAFTAAADPLIGSRSRQQCEAALRQISETKAA
jgi:hemerythrin-like domain-containing protein